MHTTNYSSFAIRVADLLSHPNTGEAYRKEIYRALTERKEVLKSVRKKLTQAGVPEETTTEIDMMLDWYTGPDGLLVAFMGEEEAVENAKKTGKDERQIDIEDAIGRDQASPEVADAPSVDDITKAIDTIRTTDNFKNFDRDSLARHLALYSKSDVDVIRGYFLFRQSNAEGAAEAAVPAVVASLLDAVINDNFDRLDAAKAKLEQAAANNDVASGQTTEPIDGDSDWMNVPLRDTDGPVESLVPKT
jgi:hypothetical protein